MSESSIEATKQVEALVKDVVSWRGDVLWIEPQGDLNLEGMLTMESEMREIILQNHHRRWVRMEVYTDKETFGPTEDVKERIEEHLRFNLERGCQYLIVVASNILIRESIANACGEVGLPMVYCHDLSQAQRWLLSKGYSLS